MRIPLLFAIAAGTACAQTPVTLGMNNFIHSTNDLQKTVAFYRDVFGLPKPPAPRPPNPAVPALTNTPGAQLQVQIFRLPGAFGFELTNFGPIEVHPAQAHPYDPGAAELMLRVRDLDAVFAAVKKAGAKIITTGGAPVTVGGGNRMLMVRDPDGYILTLSQPAAAPGADVPADSGIVGGTMGLTVGDMEKTQKFYRDLLGFDLTGSMKYVNNPAISDMAGAPKDAQYREQVGPIPGTKNRIEFHEWKGVERKAFRLRVADPGCPAIALRVADLDGLLARMKREGVKIVSQGGVPAAFGANIRNIFVEDPDGFKIELYQQTQ
jgi:catechol 2,3-dioxygenase-like lactoylglutathione lyase family enzyme